MTHSEIEAFITQFPVYQYAFVKPQDLNFDDRMRTICKQECPKYGSSWSCAPAVGKIHQCKEACFEYREVLFFSSVTEVSDILNIEETGRAKVHHEKMTQIIEDYLKENGLLVYTLSSDSCSICSKCAFPKAKCRHPKEMHPCIESHGIVTADLAELCSMDYYMGEKLRLNFSIIFYRQ